MEKECRCCNQILPLDSFRPNRRKCRNCEKEDAKRYHLENKEECNRKSREYSKAHRKDLNSYMKDYNHKTGRAKPLSKAKDAPVWLGVHVAEEVLNDYFENVKKMPYGNEGYDFKCRRGFKIDVKAACLQTPKNQAPLWQFGINKNVIADYFLCLAFDSRESLNPLHIWLIPAALIFFKKNFSISNIDISLKKWKDYEKPLDKVIAGCNVLKST